MIYHFEQYNSKFNWQIVQKINETYLEPLLQEVGGQRGDPAHDETTTWNKKQIFNWNIFEYDLIFVP